MYCREQHVIFTMTLLSFELVNDDLENILNAMCKLTGYSQLGSLYELYTQQRDASTYIRREFNLQYNSRTMDVIDKELVNLNYLQIKGSLQDVAIVIARKTDPRMPVEMVKEGLIHLAKKTMMITKAYEPTKPSSLAPHVQQRFEKHVIETLPNATVGEQIEALARTFPSDQQYDITIADIETVVNSIKITANMPPQWGTLDAASKAEFLGLTDDHVKSMLRLFALNRVWQVGTAPDYYIVRGGVTEEQLMIPPHYMNVVVIDDSSRNRKSVSFIPSARTIFKKEVILEALENALICGSTKPGKRILGWPHESNTSMFKTVNWTQDYINYAVDVLDQADRYRDKNNEYRENPHFVSRKKGIVVNKRGYANMNIERIYRPQSRIRSNETNAAPIEVISDLNLWSAMRQHIKCPNPLTEPIMHPEYTKGLYYNAIRDPALNIEKLGHHSMNYPDQIIEDLKIMEQQLWRNRSISITADGDSRAKLEAYKKQKKLI